MLVCFGLSWPLNAYKAYKAGTAAGTSWQFIALITIGYLAGIAAKLVSGQVNWVLAVYLLNLVFLGANWWVYFRNVSLDRSRVKVEEALMDVSAPLDNVLIATDGSRSSLRAIEFACSSLKGNCGKVSLLCVQHDDTEAARKLVSEAMEKAAQVVSSFEIDPVSKVRVGQPAAEIVRETKDVNASLLVMGSRGLGGIGSVLLGSVSREVADKVGCPVLVVK